jgi:hypothetical protein
MATNTLTDKEFIGIIADYYDDTYPTNYYVWIPTLLKKDELLPVQNKLNKYIAVKRRGTNVAQYSGSYTPLLADTKVIVKFSTNKIESGYIERIHYDSQAVPPGQPTDDYYLITETPNGSRIYFDNSKSRFHINNASRTDLFMDKTSIIMQTNDINNNVTSFMELSEDGFVVSFGEKTLIFNSAGFSINNGTDSNTFFNMTAKGISMKGEDFLSLDTKKLDIRGESVNLQSFGQFHIRGTILNLTGTQKAALNSSVVHIEGWMGTYIKAGLTLNLESKVFYRTQSLINDQINLAIKHTYSALESRENTMSTETSTFQANAISTIANDGAIVNNLGVATGVAPSFGASLTATSTGLTAAFTAFGTFMSFDNIASSVVGTVLTDNSIADAASVATPVDKSLMGIFFKKDDERNTFLNELNDVNIENKLNYGGTIVDYANINSPTFQNTNNDLAILSSNFLKG